MQDMVGCHLWGLGGDAAPNFAAALYPGHDISAATIPRRDAPELCKNLPPNRGRGECRVPAAPAASCAKCGNAHECRHHEFTGTPGIPARNGFNGLFRALPGDEFVLSPSLAN